MNIYSHLTADGAHLFSRRISPSIEATKGTGRDNRNGSFYLPSFGIPAGPDLGIRGRFRPERRLTGVNSPSRQAWADVASHALPLAAAKIVLTVAAMTAHAAKRQPPTPLAPLDRAPRLGARPEPRGRQVPRPGHGKSPARRGRAPGALRTLGAEQVRGAAVGAWRGGRLTCNGSLMAGIRCLFLG